LHKNWIKERSTWISVNMPPQCSIVGAIFNEGELDENSVVRNSQTTRTKSNAIHNPSYSNIYLSCSRFRVILKISSLKLVDLANLLYCRRLQEVVNLPWCTGNIFMEVFYNV